ncbi:MAG: toll/interleukin-1 receptor domain-containing protein [Aestuariivirga sp.]
MNIFLNYARADQRQVEVVYEILENMGFSPWMDTKDLIGGEDWEAGIENAIQRSDVFVPFLSRNSIKKRGVVQRELRIAFSKITDLLEDDIFILPVRLEDCDVPDRLARYQWIDCGQPNWESSFIRAIVEARRRRDDGARSGLVFEQTFSLPVIIQDVTDESEGKDISYQIPRVLGSVLT